MFSYINNNNIGNCRIHFSVRLKFKVSGIWSPSFESSNSQDYKSKAEQIERELERLYDAKKSPENRNRIRAHVIQMM